MNSFLLTFCLPLALVGCGLIVSGFFAERRANTVNNVTKAGAKAFYFSGLLLVNLQLLFLGALGILGTHQNSVLLLILFILGNGCLYLIGKRLRPVYSKQQNVSAFTEILLFSFAYLNGLLSVITGTWLIVLYGISRFVDSFWSKNLALVVLALVGAL